MVLLLGLTSFAYAAPEFYLGVSQVYNSVNTEAHDYWSDDNTELVSAPALDPGNGLSLTFGMEFPRCAVEFGLTASSHDGEDSLGGPMEATYGIFDANFKAFLSSSRHVKPYFLIGLCVTSLEVEDGARDSYWGRGDATFTGAGLNLGWGLEVKFSNVGLKGEVVYRAVEFTDVSGVDDSGTLDDPLDGSGLSVNAGINFYFN
jgi:hypothetical protein